MLHNIIYLSSASYLFSNEELIEILKISRVNNTRLDITGLLLYHDGSILQILEGEEDVLNNVYEKISKDRRHKGVIKMIDFNVKERSFKEWSMGFKQISNEDWFKLSGYLKLENKNEFSLIASSENSHIVTMIKSFTNVNLNRLNRV